MIQARYIVAVLVVGASWIVYKARQGAITYMQKLNPIVSPFFPKGYKLTNNDIKRLSNDVKLLQKNNLAKPIGNDTNIQCSVRYIIVDVLNNKNFAQQAPNYKDCYNCLGWSLWEKKHLVLSDKSFKTVDAKKQEVAGFIKLHSNFDKKDFALGSTEFPCFKLYTADEASKIANVKNAMAFYFKDNGWTHTARYVSDVPEREDIRGWTSKLNYDTLVMHDTPEKLGFMYGEVAIYAIPDVCN